MEDFTRDLKMDEIGVKSKGGDVFVTCNLETITVVGPAGNETIAWPYARELLLGTAGKNNVQHHPDPWQHRATNMRCHTCMWCAEKGVLGRCRRHAPTMSGYPVVVPNEDWCGDHKLDETKVCH